MECAFFSRKRVEPLKGCQIIRQNIDISFQYNRAESSSKILGVYVCNYISNISDVSAIVSDTMYNVKESLFLGSFFSPKADDYDDSYS